MPRKARLSLSASLHLFEHLFKLAAIRADTRVTGLYYSLVPLRSQRLLSGSESIFIISSSAKTDGTGLIYSHSPTRVS